MGELEKGVRVVSGEGSRAREEEGARAPEWGGEEGVRRGSAMTRRQIVEPVHSHYTRVTADAGTCKYCGTMVTGANFRRAAHLCGYAGARVSACAAIDDITEWVKNEMNNECRRYDDAKGLGFGLRVSS